MIMHDAPRKSHRRSEGPCFCDAVSRGLIPRERGGVRVTAHNSLQRRPQYRGENAARRRVCCVMCEGRRALRHHCLVVSVMLLGRSAGVLATCAASSSPLNTACIGRTVATIVKDSGYPHLQHVWSYLRHAVARGSVPAGSLPMYTMQATARDEVGVWNMLATDPTLMHFRTAGCLNGTTSPNRLSVLRPRGYCCDGRGPGGCYTKRAGLRHRWMVFRCTRSSLRHGAAPARYE